MLRTSIFLLMAAVTLTSCGVRRPLIAPKDIPAHDEKRQKDAEKYHTNGQQEPDDDEDEDQK